MVREELERDDKVDAAMADQDARIDEMLSRSNRDARFDVQLRENHELSRSTGGRDADERENERYERLPGVVRREEGAAKEGLVAPETRTSMAMTSSTSSSSSQPGGGDDRTVPTADLPEELREKIERLRVAGETMRALGMDASKVDAEITDLITTYYMTGSTKGSGDGDDDEDQNEEGRIEDAREVPEGAVEGVTVSESSGLEVRDAAEVVAEDGPGYTSPARHRSIDFNGPTTTISRFPQSIVEALSELLADKGLSTTKPRLVGCYVMAMMNMVPDDLDAESRAVVDTFKDLDPVLSRLDLLTESLSGLAGVVKRDDALIRTMNERVSQIELVQAYQVADRAVITRMPVKASPGDLTLRESSTLAVRDQLRAEAARQGSSDRHRVERPIR